MEDDMAEFKAFVQKWEKELTCSFCQKILNDPRTFPCRHSFCSNCVETTGMDCPTCKTTIDVPCGKPSKLYSLSCLNYFLQLLHVMQAKANQPGVHECASCEKSSNFVAFCPECDGSICEECVEAHTRIKKVQLQHKLLKFSDCNEEYLASCVHNEMEGKRKLPEENHFAYFCEDEKCRECQNYAVSNQKYLRLQSLEKDISRIEKLKESSEKELEESKKNMEKIRQDVELAKNDVCRTKEMICNKVREQSEAMISALDRTQQEQRTATANQQKEIERGIQELSKHLQQLNALKNRGLSYSLEETEKALQEKSQELMEASHISAQVQRHPKVRYLTDQYLTRSLQDMGKIVTTFGEHELGMGQFAGQFNHPQSIAVSDNGEIAIADCHNHRIQILSVDGNYIREFGIQGTGDGQLVKPFGVVFNEGRVIVSDAPDGNGGRIQEFDLNGTHVKTIYRPEQWFVPRGMCVDEEKNIAVCCYGNHGLGIKASVKVFNKRGDLVREFGVPDDDEQPWYITYGNGKYFVSFNAKDYFCVFDKNGVFLRKFGERGTKGGQFLGIGGLAVYGLDTILVCDVGNERVQLLTQEGCFLRSFESQYLGEGNLTSDIAVTADSRVVVLEGFTGCIQIWC